MSETTLGNMLLVEDNPQDLELALHALTKANLAHRVQVARDGVEALDFVFAEGRHASRATADLPRVILLDLKLPKVNGLEVLRRIKASPHTKTIPVIILSSSKEQSDIATSYRLGANSYVAKPVAFEQFGEAVREIGLYWMLLNEAPETTD